MRLRLAAVSFIALMFALAQVSGGAMSLLGDARAYAASIDQRPAGTVLANNNDNTSASSDNSDASSDNDNNSANDDNTDNDNDSANDDNTDDNSDGSSASTDTGSAAGTAAGGSTATFDSAALMQPLAVASGTSNGSDVMVAPPGERIAVQIFPWMPAGIQALTIRPVDPNTVMAAPGQRAGDLERAIEARDANGNQLTSLPAEVNLAVRYADETVSGLNESTLTLSRLDPSTNQWQAAPKIVRETDSNYVVESITQLGT